MNQANIKAFLKEVKRLVSEGKREFIHRKYRKADGATTTYFEALLDIGIVTINQAWKEILKLKPNDYFRGPTPDHKDSSSDVWEFKKTINGTLVYIKLKIDQTRGCVCMSFHKDWL